MRTSVAVLVAIALGGEAAANEITVIGTRSQRALKDAAAPIRVIERREIEAAGDLTAADAVTRVAGIRLDANARGQTPQIQGFASKHVLVLIDGKRATGRVADDFDLARIPAAQIERIEILKGASSVLYGSDAIGGVINIVTRRPKRGWQGSARVGRDSLQRDDAALGLAGGNDTVSAAADAAATRGPGYDLDPRDRGQTVGAYEKIWGEVELDVAATDSIRIMPSVSVDSHSTSRTGTTGGGAVIDRSNEAGGRTAKLVTSYRGEGDDEIRLELSEGRHQDEFTEDQRGAVDLDRVQRTSERTREASLVASTRLSAAHQTVAGVETLAQELRSDRLTSGAAHRSRGSAFLQHEWSLAAARPLRLVPGLRFDRDSQFGGHVSRALAMRFDATPETVLRLAYGEGYRAPSFVELLLDFENPGVGYRVAGNPELRPERSRSVQASVAWAPSPAVWTSLGIFDNRVRDLIATRGEDREGDGTLIFTYVNEERARTQGVEWSGRLRRGDTDAEWSVGADYAFLQARDETKRRTLAGRALHSGSLLLGFESRSAGFGAALTTTLTGKRPYYVEERQGEVTRWSGPYRHQTLRLRQAVGGGVELFAGARNLTDEYDDDYNPVAPRSYFGGASATF